MVNLAEPFAAYERQTWRPPDHLSGVEWAERHITIPARGNAEPGPLRMDRTPALREILNKLCDDRTQYITLCKGVQIGGSTVVEAAIGFWIDNFGDPILLVFPTENATKERLEKKLKPLIKNNPQLSRWETGDRNAFTKDLIQLAHMDIYPGWSGSAQTLASRAIRCGIEDETDKSKRISSEASTGELLDARTTTYMHRRKVGRLSTPTSRQGEIWKALEQCSDRRRWHVPCPHCEHLIILEFKQVHWEGKESEKPAEWLEQVAALESEEIQASYVCQECGEEFGEAKRLAIQQRGQWVSDGREPGDLPDSVRIAYHLPSINSSWVSLNRLASVFLKCALRGDPHYFLNNMLALPSEDPGREISSNLFTERAVHAPHVAPNWATCIVASADTQAKDGNAYWYYMVRAWGPGPKGHLRSRLLDYGLAYSPEELKERTLGTSFAVEERSGHFLRPTILMVDSGGGVELDALDGNTRDVVYQMALADPQRVVPIKGHGGNKKPDTLVKLSLIKYAPRSKPNDPRNVQLQILDTQGLKDKLNYLIHCDDPVLWEESTAVNDEYASHMSGEEKANFRKLGGWVQRWAPKSSGRRVDWWDAAVYSLAGAILLGAAKRSPEVEARIAATPKPARKPAQQKYPRPGRRGGWIAKRPRR